MSNGLAASRRLSQFVDRQSSLTSIKDAAALLKALTRLTLPFSWPIPLCMMVGVLLAIAIVRSDPKPAPSPPGVVGWTQGLLGDLRAPNEDARRAWKRSPWGQDLGLAFDGATQGWGGFFCIVGMSLGMVILRYGVEIAPAKK
jgi:hypothetical protein